MAAWINICFAIVVGTTALNGVGARSSGAPTDACDTMTPNHLGTEPSELPRPFTITASPKRFVAGEPVRGQHLLSSVVYIYKYSYSC